MLTAFVAAGSANAIGVQVDLGTAGAYSTLGGQAVTNTGPSQLSGDVGVSPGTAITGFPPGIVGGSTHAADAAALQAQSDLTIAYNQAAGETSTASVSGDLVGQSLTPGVYNSTGPLALSGTLTLNAQGDPNAVFIFQAASTLITASASDVNMINGAQACNVFWQVGSSATLGTNSVFRGSILALSSVSVTTGAVVQGRALARNGAVTLDDNTFTSAACDATIPATPSTTTETINPTTTTPGSTITVTADVTGATTPTGTVVFTSDGTTVGTASVNSTGHATLRLNVGTRLGTRTITASYTGNPTLLPSTSNSTSVLVRAVPTTSSPSTPVPTTTPPTNGAPPITTSSPPITTTSTPPTTTSSTPPLATTGTQNLSALVAAAAALLAVGSASLWVGRRRRHGATQLIGRRGHKA